MNNIVRKSCNNNGFSLVELIVMVAIMTIMAGGLTLSISLLIGSEARKAAESVSAQLNEVKTGSMSRYGEDFNIVYVDNAGDFDWADREGYYVVKQMTTMSIDATTKMPVASPLGVEHRYLCNNRVTMEFDYSATSEYEVLPENSKGIGLKFDRGTGMFEAVMINCSIENDGSVSYPSGNEYAINKNSSVNQPKTLKMKSGLKTYTIEFDSATGKHSIMH